MVQMANAGKFKNPLFSTVSQVVENLCYCHCLNKQNLHFARTCRGIKKTTIWKYIPKCIEGIQVEYFRPTEKVYLDTIAI